MSDKTWNVLTFWINLASCAAFTGLSIHNGYKGDEFLTIFNAVMALVFLGYAFRVLLREVNRDSA